MSIYEAYFKFQNCVNQPIKDGSNPAFKNSKYVTIDGLMEVVKPALRDSGLILYQVFGFLDGAHGLRTILMNKTGDTIESFIPVVPDKNARVEMQGFGSATTYTRRYAIEAICGLCGTVDDDGNGASGSVKKRVVTTLDLVRAAYTKAEKKDAASLVDFLESKGLTPGDIGKLDENGLRRLLTDLNGIFK